jgi:ribonuclease HII
MAMPDLSLEQHFWRRGVRTVAGVDEAGRGAWAGPLVAAVVVLGPEAEGFAYDDSKRLSAGRRERLAEHVRAHARAWSVAVASSLEVDRLGPLGATHLAAQRAIALLSAFPDAFITDYLKLTFERLPQPEVMAPPRADARSLSVAAASLLAKTHRDALMRQAAQEWPAYAFERHKGYGVAVHRAALEREGPCPIHRRRFSPIRDMVAAAGVEAPLRKDGSE